MILLRFHNNNCWKQLSSCSSHATTRECASVIVVPHFLFEHGRTDVVVPTTTAMVDGILYYFAATKTSIVGRRF